MPRSVVELSKLNALDAVIRAFDSNTDATMAAYYQSAMSLLAQFKAKLEVLSKDRDVAWNNFRQCKAAQALNPNLSCAFQANQLQRANERFSRCSELVDQALQAISEYNSHANHFRYEKNGLCSKARIGIDRVRTFIDEYNSNPIPDIDNFMSGNAIPNMSTFTETDGQGGSAGTFMFATAGTTSGKSKERKNKGFEHLPLVSEPDKQALHLAAQDIADSLKGEGSSIGAKELLLQQKADAVFEQQYGISRTDLLASSETNIKEYVDAYNKIQNGIRMELKLL